MSDVEVPNGGAGLDDLGDYRPTGPCAECQRFRTEYHEATHIWPLYRGKLRYEFRCACCTVKGRLERAREQVGRIPELEREYAEAMRECGQCAKGHRRVSGGDGSHFCGNCGINL